MFVSDYAVLVIAVHSALQVFQPDRSSRTDGLCQYRYPIYSGTMSMPVIMVALAFINPEGGYIAQGAFCSLPLRPYWHRLGLT
jgi:G protein-coupled receptor GPR1